MKEQSYQHHIRYYTTHHFIFYPVVLAATMSCVYFSFHDVPNRLIWLALTGTLLMIAWLSYMLRQHYALNNQNRIVRLEMRFRYYVLTHERFEPIEAQLTLSQLFALRFACDEELPALVQRALKESLSPDQIRSNKRCGPGCRII
ncbi:MAG: hypothetical protein JWO58_634 [Chitinophagaceae bacterium]|nr:hypothetical protein [Chitinophagaceae bacterium]